MNSNKRNTLCVILARAGSKGIKKKNIVDFGGKPLVAWTIRAAIDSKKFDHVVVSTDSKQIREIALNEGAQVPFLRDEKLSGDNVLSAIALKDAVKKSEDYFGKKYDVICELQATSPLRDANDVVEAVSKFYKNPSADSLYSVYELNHFHPKKIKKIDSNGFLEDLCSHFSESKIGRRQDAKSLYVRNGAIFVMKRDVLFENNDRVGKNCLAYIMPEEKSLNIDSLTDLEVGKVLLKCSK